MTYLQCMPIIILLYWYDYVSIKNNILNAYKCARLFIKRRKLSLGAVLSQWSEFCTCRVRSNQCDTFITLAWITNNSLVFPSIHFTFSNNRLCSWLPACVRKLLLHAARDRNMLLLSWYCWDSCLARTTLTFASQLAVSLCVLLLILSETDKQNGSQVSAQNVDLTPVFNLITTIIGLIKVPKKKVPIIIPIKKKEIKTGKFRLVRTN